LVLIREMVYLNQEPLAIMLYVVTVMFSVVL